MHPQNIQNRTLNNYKTIDKTYEQYHRQTTYDNGLGTVILWHLSCAFYITNEQQVYTKKTAEMIIISGCNLTELVLTKQI